MSGQVSVSPLLKGDPEQLGSYRLVGRIGRGGMGIVYLADSGAGERAAIKVISPDLAHDDAFRARFRREVESARRVRRFCTAPVLDAQLDGEPLYIVTEYVDGPNLDQFIRTSGPMRGSSLDHLAVGVATALTAIHGAGIIHRDLKPANVLLSSVGPRVIDFGIARALDTVDGATRTGQFVGTPAYMAPEVIDGKPATAASDVFAWGCVVAYAGTGQAPFAGPTVPAVMYQIMHAEPSLDGVDEALREVVQQALDKDPAKRPSGQELLDRLVGQDHADTAQIAESVRRTWPSEAVPTAAATMPPPPYRTRQDMPQTAPYTGPAPTQPVGSPPGPPGPPRPPGQAGRPSGRTLALVGAVVAAVVVVAALIAVVLNGSGGGVPSKTSSVFDDDFSNNSSGWSGSTWTSGSGYFTGGYRVDAGGYSPIRSEPAPYEQTVPERVLVTADARALGGPDYGQLGLFCRSGEGSGSDTTLYAFLVRADGKGTLIRKVNGQSGTKELANKSSAPGFKKGATNHLQVACERESGKVHLRFWLNGDLAAEATDADRPLPTGAAGLMAAQEGGGSSGDMQAWFDNFHMATITG
ncbi:MAG TPA: serine/threonine-protein kinase [Streptosporangiaceae bacterium]